ncbi:MAG TPA: hypothetical protein VNH15_04480 [Elusimicrobiota bacterium]|nr:hypothetical protein [Elusimicrobiota bacterium]
MRNGKRTLAIVAALAVLSPALVRAQTDLAQTYFVARKFAQIGNKRVQKASAAKKHASPQIMPEAGVYGRLSKKEVAHFNRIGMDAIAFLRSMPWAYGYPDARQVTVNRAGHGLRIFYHLGAREEPILDAYEIMARRGSQGGLNIYFIGPRGAVMNTAVDGGGDVGGDRALGGSPTLLSQFWHEVDFWMQQDQ